MKRSLLTFVVCGGFAASAMSGCLEPVDMNGADGGGGSGGGSGGSGGGSSNGGGSGGSGGGISNGGGSGGSGGGSNGGGSGGSGGGNGGAGGGTSVACIPGPGVDGGVVFLAWTTTNGAVATAQQITNAPVSEMLADAGFGASVYAVISSLTPHINFYSLDGGRAPDAFGCLWVAHNINGSLLTWFPPACRVIITGVACSPGDYWEGKFWADHDGGVDKRAVFDGGFRVRRPL